MKVSCIFLSLFLVLCAPMASYAAQENVPRKAPESEAAMKAQADDEPGSGIVACVSSTGKVRLVAPYIPCRPIETRVALHKVVYDQIVAELKNELSSEIKNQLSSELKLQLISEMPPVLAPLVVPLVTEQLQLCPDDNPSP